MTERRREVGSIVPVTDPPVIQPLMGSSSVRKALMELEVEWKMETCNFAIPPLGFRFEELTFGFSSLYPSQARFPRKKTRMAYALLYGMALQDIFFCFLVPVLLYLPTGSRGSEVPRFDPQPEFLMPLENHTVTQGREVVFTCVVNHLQSYKVAWIKSDSRAILAIHTHMVAHNSRLSVTHNGFNTWKLHVANVQPNDSGTYMCQVNTDPMRSQTGYMKVVVPPDIIDLDENSNLLTTEEKGEISLQCRATGSPEPEITWRREDGKSIIIRNKKESGQRRSVKIYKGEQLHLTGILRQEMGSYLCIASNGIPPSVSKRYYVNVLFKPTIRVNSQLVTVPINSNVNLHCYVESSPRTLNVWYKNNGTKIVSNEKFEMKEIQLNEYTYQSNLAIRNVGIADFGSYFCFSENALGNAECSISLKEEINLDKTTVSPIRYTEFFGRGRKKQSNKEKSNKKHNLYSTGREKSEVFLDNKENLNNSIQNPKKKLSIAVTTKILNPPSLHPALSPKRAHFPSADDFEMYNVSVSLFHFRLNWLRLITILFIISIFV
ncbi:lachesin-like [Belonocnema kinseyi]|uniref:lachesin-like n=1 Tax=Belonocnema kinseyi TaxID=2817044 RepID=UPI00143D1163|nr:lachesin-like [Belonocnema kinseyi]